MTAVGEGIGWTLIVIGAGLTLISAVGLHRFRSVFARMHAAGKSTTLGILLTLCGSALVVGGRDRWTLLLGAGLLVLTAPTGFNAVGRAAEDSPEEPHGERRLDERLRTGERPGASRAGPL